MTCRPLAVLLLLPALLPHPALAQLLSDQVQDQSRICTYVGTQATADGQLAAKTLSLSVSQPCPETAPFRDPNAPPPGNAMLTGERAEPSGRLCTYSQAGVDYQIPVAITQRCAPTPALLARAQADGRSSER